MSRRPFTNGNHRDKSAAERSALREALRRQLFEAEGGLCWLCGKPMTLERRITSKRGKIGRTFASFDHVVPKTDGGTTYYTNLKLAHRGCNSARNARPAVNGNNRQAGE